MPEGGGREAYWIARLWIPLMGLGVVLLYVAAVGPKSQLALFAMIPFLAVMLGAAVAAAIGVAELRQPVPAKSRLGIQIALATNLLIPLSLLTLVLLAG